MGHNSIDNTQSNVWLDLVYRLFRDSVHAMVMLYFANRSLTHVTPNLLHIHADHLIKKLNANAPTTAAARISSWITYGTHRPVEDVTDVPH
ncbi:hypothetical protein N9B31_10340 [Mariniblastus sp.]|nr:hypothetical protein [Mariniblastus sp.]MDA7924725.1 hypothetical protein [Mariniblastus sp.]